MKIPENPMRIQPTGLPEPIRKPGQVEQPKELRFGEQLKELLNAVNDKGFAADQSVQAVVKGESDDLHNAMVALEEASVSFQLMLEIRNKMLEAYQEINRMNI